MIIFQLDQNKMKKGNKRLMEEAKMKKMKINHKQKKNRN